MIPKASTLTVRLAQTQAEVRAAQALRYRVFIADLGGSGALVDHDNQLECDRFDAHAKHLILWDHAGPKPCAVGVYRLMDRSGAAAHGYASEMEYDLSALHKTGRSLLELSRSCVHPDYRDGQGIFILWQALSHYIIAHQIEVLFGVASFHGTDPAQLAAPLNLLHDRHLAPAELRPISRAPVPVPPVTVDAKAALLQVPALIKAYLRLGGMVGEGAYIDRDFNTIDVCMVLDMAKVSPRQVAIYTRARP